MKIRIFIAIKIEDLALEKLIKIKNELFQNRELNWEPKEKLHITLNFIGKVDEEVIPNLIARLKKITKNFSPFVLNFYKFGLFKRKGIPSILWAGIEENETLSNLHFEIDSILSNIGFVKDSRNYRPHLTLIRFKKNIQNYNFESKLEKNISDIKFKIDGFSLFKSELKNSGSVYTEIKNIKLK
jgi:2'-5' RNA ligase